MIPSRRSRPIELARAAWGAGLLVAPRAVLTRVHHLQIDEKSLVVARILGGRQLAQALLSGIRPSPEVLAMGVWVDAAHASSAVGLAVVDRGRARGGLTDAAVATLWAVAGYRDLTRASATPPAHDRRRDRLARMVLGICPVVEFCSRRWPPTAAETRPDKENDMPDPDEIVTQLHDLLERTDGLRELVEKSLRQAGEIAAAELDPPLYEALPWPRDLDEYGEYLRGFIRWIPQQSDDPAWKSDAPQHRYAKEVSDRLAHFFWLVDQKVDEGDTAIAENSDTFRDWLTEFARQWGSFLDTPESFDQQILDSFLKYAPEYTIEESLVDGKPNMPSGWATFNQFFARELNAGLRPITDPDSNLVITSPADCSFQHGYDIDDESNIPATTIKHMHKYGNIAQLIEGSRYADSFAGGTFVHYMLPPSAYHRFHTPVAGVVRESFVVQGKVFMQVDLADHELKSKDAANTGYEFSQTRGVLTIDTTGSPAGDIGVVAVVPVGMSHVASVVMTGTEGRHVAKGEEFGYFQFGGSDIVIVLQPGVELDIDTDTDPRHVGSVVARVLARE